MNRSPRNHPLRRDLQVPVPGGALSGIEWLPTDAVGPDAVGPTVVALHGLTSNAAVWCRTVDHLDVGARVLAPDLRGRGASRCLPGPYDLASLADDVQRMLDLERITDTVLVGHSMGGFLAARIARRIPERVSHLLLVDGGIPYRDSTGGTAVPPVVQEGIATRLNRSFATDGDFHRFYREATTPGLTIEDPHLRRYLDRGRFGVDGGYRWACSTEAAQTAMGGLYRTGPLDMPGPLPSGHPVELLCAGVRRADEPHGYTADQLARLPAHIRHQVVPDTDHFTIVLSETGARSVAARVDAAVLSSAR